MRRAFVVAVSLVFLLLALPAAADVTVNAIFSSGLEGDSGSKIAPVTLTQTPQNFPITYTYRTIDGTATAADGDFRALDSSVTIPAGETTATIPVEIFGDRKLEADETFTLLVEGLGLDDGEFIFTIQNDDVATATIANASVTEGSGTGMTPLLFTVTLTAPAAIEVRGTFFTTPGTAADTSDYNGTQGTIVFPAGTTQQQITIPVVPDIVFEPDETFTVTVQLPNTTPITATGTILNDDPAPPASTTIVSGNNQPAILGQPLAQPLTVEVRNIQGAPASGVTVRWEVTRGTAQLNPATSTTNAQGRATTIVTPTSTGDLEITATAAALAPVRFTFTAAISLESSATGPVAVPIARVLDRICARNEAVFAEVCRSLSSLPGSRVTAALERVAPQQSGAQAKIATEVVSAVTAGIASRLAAVRTGTASSMGRLTLNHNGKSIPVGAVASTLLGGGAGDEDDTYNGWSAFISGNFGDGERNPDPGQLGFDLKSRGLMAGADRLVGASSIVGASINWMQLESDLEDDAGSVDTDGYALSIYASRGGLFAGDKAGTGRGTRFDGVHLDGSVTYGRNTYDTEHVVVIGDVPVSRAAAENDANVLALSAGGGIDLHRGRTDFDLSLNGTWSRADIDDMAEEGNGPLILFVQGHEIESVTATGGLNVRSVFDAPFGTIMPSLRAELVHEFESGARLVTARFLRDTLGTSFTIPLDTPDQNYGRLGAGLQAGFAYGWSAFVEYSQDFMRDDLDFSNIQFLIRKSF